MFTMKGLSNPLAAWPAKRGYIGLKKNPHSPTIPAKGKILDYLGLSLASAAAVQAAQTAALAASKAVAGQGFSVARPRRRRLRCGPWRPHADWPVAMPDTEHHQGGRPGVFHQVDGRGDVVIFPTVAAEGRVMSATVAGARAGRRDGPWAEPSGVLGSSGGPSAEPSALAEPAREHPPAAALIAGTAFASGRAPCH